VFQWFEQRELNTNKKKRIPGHSKPCMDYTSQWENRVANYSITHPSTVSTTPDHQSQYWLSKHAIFTIKLSDTILNIQVKSSRGNYLHHSNMSLGKQATHNQHQRLLLPNRGPSRHCHVNWTEPRRTKRNRKLAAHLEDHLLLLLE
jgi:hypothetical protein